MLELVEHGAQVLRALRRGDGQAAGAHVELGAEPLEHARGALQRLVVAERKVHAPLADARLQLRGGPGGDGPAAGQHDDLVGQAVGLLEVLGGQQQRGAALDQALDRAPHVRAAGGVEPGGGLVEEDDGAVDDEAGGEVESPAHAAGVGADLAVGGVSDAEPLEQLARARGRVALGEPLQAREQHQVLAAGEPLVERRLLAGQRDLLADGSGRGDDVMAGDERAALGRGERVVRMRTAVVFPAPLWPSRPSTVPASTTRSRLASAGVAP